MNYKEFTTEGVKGVCVVREKSRIFHTIISMHIENVLTNAKQNASALLYTEMLLSGAATLDRESFFDELHLLGGSIEISLKEATVVFTLQCLSEHKKKLLLLFSKMLRTPHFKNTELCRVKIQLKNQLVLAKENEKKRAFEQLRNHLYTSTDWRHVHTADELVEACSVVTTRDLKVLHKKVLSKQWTVTTTGTDIETHTTISTLKQLRKYFGTERSEPAVPSAHVLHGHSIDLTSIPSKQNVEVAIGAHTQFTLGDSDAAACLLGLQILGKPGSFATRLMSTIREKEGLTYGIYARNEGASLQHTGYWRVSSFFAPEKTVGGIRAIIREVQSIIKKGVTEQELARFKNFFTSEQMLLQDSVFRICADVHGYISQGFSIEQMSTFKESFEHLTREAVNTALRKHLSTTNFTIAVAGPVAAIKKDLLKLQEKGNL